MPLYLFFTRAFNRSFKRLGYQQQKLVARTIEVLEQYYLHDSDLSVARRMEPGFFHKQLRKPFYECGIDSRLRVVIERRGSDCLLVLAGNHDQVKKFLLQV